MTKRAKNPSRGDRRIYAQRAAEVRKRAAAVDVPEPPAPEPHVAEPPAPSAPADEPPAPAPETPAGSGRSYLARLWPWSKR